METKMKIKEYAADVVEYTEVVDAPYNFNSDEEVLDERPMGFIKGGLQKLGAKVLPGSFGSKMQGKVDTGKQANQLYSEFHTFLGRSGYESTDDALKAFLQQKGINVDVDSILKSVAPPAAAAPPATPPASGGSSPPAPPVTESVDQLDRILFLSGRPVTKKINENKTNKKTVLNEGL